MMDSPAPPLPLLRTPREIGVTQLRNLLETLASLRNCHWGYLITSSELADLMDVHASAVTSRGDEWRWRNWIVSRVRREGNQILWELERGDEVIQALSLQYLYPESVLSPPLSRGAKADKKIRSTARVSQGRKPEQPTTCCLVRS